MRNSKRKWSHKTESDNIHTTPKSAIVQLFQTFAVELEDKQDRYERLVKVSRDITVESKRLIFFLHSHRRGSSEGEKILCEAKARLTNIVKLYFSKVLGELDDRDIYQFLRSFSFGVQEFVEAFSFYHYLMTETLLTYNEVLDFLNSNATSKIDVQSVVDVIVAVKEHGDTLETQSCNLHPKNHKTNWIKPRNHCVITEIDYVLGLNDLTGELMRYSINQVANGEIQAAFDVCRFLTSLYSGMLSVSLNSREYNRKMFTVMQSVKKVEMACYTIRVRGSEMPKKMIFSVLEDENVCEEDAHF